MIRWTTPVSRKRIT